MELAVIDWIIIVAYFLVTKGEPEVHIHGFDFFRDSNDGKGHHYYADYERGDQQGWHTGYAERRFAERLKEEGKIVFLVD